MVIKLDYSLAGQIMAIILLLYLAWGQIKLFGMINGVGTLSAHILYHTMPAKDREATAEELTDKVIEHDWRNWDGKQG